LPVTLFSTEFGFAPTATTQYIFKIRILLWSQNSSIAWNSANQMMELALDRFEIIKNIRMIELKVVHHQRAWMVMDELRTLIKKSTVVFVRFDNKEDTFAKSS